MRRKQEIKQLKNKEMYDMCHTNQLALLCTAGKTKKYKEILFTTFTTNLF